MTDITQTILTEKPNLNTFPRKPKSPNPYTPELE